MMGVRLNSPEMLDLFWVLPVLALLILHGHLRRKASLVRVAGAAMLSRLSSSVSCARQWAKRALYLGSVFLLVIGLARPAWNPTIETSADSGRDVAVLLDVSRSMLAEDVKPSRLEHARLAVCDLLEGLKGERVGLVLFAGSASLKCPLTQDYEFFRTVLLEQGTDSVPLGGSRIGDALRTAEQSLFRDGLERRRTIVLITDGEDQGSMPVDAASKLGNSGIELVVVGVGDPQEGGRIPLIDSSGMPSFLRHRDEVVWSRLNSSLLREMASANPRGRYLQAATGIPPLGRLLRTGGAAADGEPARPAGETVVYREKFQIFLLTAWLLLAMELLISERRGVH